MTFPITPEGELLNLLIEECAEIIQEATKIKRFGFVANRAGEDGVTTYHNREALTRELGDVQAVIDRMRECGMVNPYLMADARVKHMEKIRENTFYQFDSKRHLVDGVNTKTIEDKPQGFEYRPGKSVYVGDDVWYNVDGSIAKLIDVFQDGDATIKFPDGSIQQVKWRSLTLYRRRAE